MIKNNVYESLRSRLDIVTEDIEAFSNITDDAASKCTDTRHVFRKAYFLGRVAAELPTVLFPDEKIVGSMRTYGRHATVPVSLEIVNS